MSPAPAVFQSIEILPHPFVDGSVPALYQIVGLDEIPLLEHIVRDQHGSLSHEPQHFRKEADVLTLGRVHENKVIGSVQCLQHLRRVPGNQRNPLAVSGSFNILPGYGNSLLIIFNGSDPAVLRTVFRHKDRRKSNGCANFQDFPRSLYHQKYF